MRKTLGYVSAVALLAGLAAGATSPQGVGGHRFFPITGADAASIFHQSAINGTTNNTAVIAPTFFSTNNTTPHSYIRFFNGAGLAGSHTTSTFSITIVGDKTGNPYGSPFTIAIPHMASIQYGIHELVGLAGVTLGSFTGGDTGYVVYVQNPDSEAGFMSAVYDWGSKLFENMSMCNTNINEQMSSLHNEMVLTNVHTSVGPNQIGQNFPSTIRIHNYYNIPITYRMTIFNAGSRTSTGAISTDAGNQICQIASNTTVPANTTMTVPVSTIEANPACSTITAADYINVVIADQSGGAPNAVVSQTVGVSAYNGNTSMTPTCAVNAVNPNTTSVPNDPYT